MMPCLKLNECWSFMLALYDYKDTQTLLIDLQDTVDVNVNIALISVYMASLGYELDTPLLARILEGIAESNRQLKLFRRHRRALKPGNGAANQADYEKAKQAELALEKQQVEAILAIIKVSDVQMNNADVMSFNLDVLKSSLDCTKKGSDAIWQRWCDNASLYLARQ